MSPLKPSKRIRPSAYLKRSFTEAATSEISGEAVLIQASERISYRFCLPILFVASSVTIKYFSGSPGLVSSFTLRSAPIMGLMPFLLHSL